MVVENVRHRRRQTPVVLRVGLRVRLAEEEELELGTDHRLEAGGARPLDLRLQDRARPRRDRLAVGGDDVAEDERGPFEPWRSPQRGQVRNGHEVAVALVPVGHGVAGPRLVVHVRGEEVGAALEPVLERVVEEEPRVEALAHQPALHVGERSDDGVDRPALDLLPQLVDGQHQKSSRYSSSSQSETWSA